MSTPALDLIKAFPKSKGHNGRQFFKGLATAEFIWYFDYQESDENAGSIMFNLASGALISSNYFSYSAAWEAMVDNKQIWASRYMQYNVTEVQKEAAKENAAPEPTTPAPAAPNTITRQKYPPEVAANPGARWYGEIRRSGWLIDYTRKDTEAEVDQWLNDHTGEGPTPHVANEYANMVTRWANK